MLLKCFSCLPRVPGDPFLHPPAVTALRAGFLSHLPRLPVLVGAEGVGLVLVLGDALSGVWLFPKMSIPPEPGWPRGWRLRWQGTALLQPGDISRAGDTCPVPPAPGVLRLWRDE